MKFDSIALSAIWGRVGASILAAIAMLLAFAGYTFSDEDQALASNVIVGIITGISGALALFSKAREIFRRITESKKQ